MPKREPVHWIQNPTYNPEATLTGMLRQVINGAHELEARDLEYRRKREEFRRQLRDMRHEPQARTHPIR